MTVVDTPGWLSHSTTPNRVSQELCRGLTLCHPEPHVILLVLPTTTTFSQEEGRAMQTQLSLLHTAIWQRAMVLFTHGDKLGKLMIIDLCLICFLMLIVYVCLTAVVLQYLAGGQCDIMCLCDLCDLLDRSLIHTCVSHLLTRQSQQTPVGSEINMTSHITR